MWNAIVDTTIRELFPILSLSNQHNLNMLLRYLKKKKLLLQMTFLRFASRIKIIQPWQFMSFQGVLCIDDMDLDVLNEMIHYIYCGKCTKDITEMASDLLIAADKYRLEELKARKFYFKKNHDRKRLNGTMKRITFFAIQKSSRISYFIL